MSILIVEDNTISLRAVEMILHSHGLETVSAKTGKQAVDVLAVREDIQVILSDLMMPEMDGFQLLEVLGKHPAWSKIPVVIMTSISDAETVKKVVSRGCKHYLIKPVREEALLPKVRQVLADVPATTETPLRPKFKVLEESGLEPKQYEDLFDAFNLEVREAVGFLSVGVPPPGDPSIAAFLRMREGAALLAGGRLQALLDGLKARGSCDWDLLRETLGTLAKAMETAIERRERMREKLSRQSGEP
ncbi:MAG: response regulator [Fibrobacterota bacterium]|nr:response regulator [Fibrobacterota bacterium]QQS04069.1 MAG: response regulator [Fibrobacterota bacterium]